MDDNHPDFPTLDRIRRAIEEKAGGHEKLTLALPLLLQSAIEFVIDPVRTARTAISDLDPVEKTFVGLKVEHFFRDFIGLPKGIRDLQIDGLDVDVKNTVGATWMIPPETYRSCEPVILFAVATERRLCSLGIFVAKQEYLGKPNRDQKRSVLSKSRAHILWLIENLPLPASKWVGIDMEKFRAIRSIVGGNKRAIAFFKDHLGVRVHRSVLQSLLHDQLDFTRRLRRDKRGVPNFLRRDGIALISGDETAVLTELALELDIDEYIAFKPNSDRDRTILRRRKLID